MLRWQFVKLSSCEGCQADRWVVESTVWQQQQQQQVVGDFGSREMSTVSDRSR